MVNYIWIRDSVPKNLDVRQVYGIVFSEDGRILLRLEDNSFELTGGHPEKIDRCFEDTLKREYIEELNVEIKDIHYLGYLYVEENQDRFAQVRMISKIKKINEARPDLDNGKIYQRYLVGRNNAKRYLNYSDEAGNQMLDDAVNAADERFSFNEYSENEEVI